MSFVTDIKDTIIRKVSSSFLLHWIDGYKSTIGRVVQGVNALITAAYILGGVYDQYKGGHVVDSLNSANAQWGLLTSWLVGHGILEVGIQDKKAKENLGY